MPLQVGLTGGIGSGKSTVARLLGDLGAVVVDLDAIARDVLAPGTKGLALVSDAFPGVVADGRLDRAALGEAVFGDDAARAQLEAITHPLIHAEASRRIAAVPEGSVVVHDVPLLVEKHLEGRYDVVVVVGASEEVRRERLRTTRGMDDATMDARFRAQADDDARRAVADVWLPNEGSESDLREAVRELWEEVLLPRVRDGAGG
ncbi:MAG: dephospho-CoA kinase [Actinomycetota bacterium]